MDRTLDNLDMVDIWIELNGNRNEYTFSSVVHGIFIKIDHKNFAVSTEKQKC